jgi:hypothetical protein
MNIHFIRGIVSGMYDGPKWKERVLKMDEDQLIAIYLRFQRDGSKPPEPKTSEPQLRLF